MKGIHKVSVKNRDASFQFELHRNITVVRGDSGTGKTTLFDMIADYTRLKSQSGVNLSCDKDCVALVDIDWKNQLHQISDSIVFIDEGFASLKTKEFAGEIKDTDNYYVIFSREPLHELPYSVSEIYEIRTSGKYHSFRKLFQPDEKHVYHHGKHKREKDFDTVLTEDMKSGFEFFDHYFQNTEIACDFAASNSAIFRWLKGHKDNHTFVIADGAAFGSEIDRILKLPFAVNIRLCLPESFEWLILKSGLIHTADLSKIMENPAAHIESRDYFSWEQYFETYLIENTLNTPFQYAKREINAVYLIEVNAEKIISEIL